MTPEIIYLTVGSDQRLNPSILTANPAFFLHFQLECNVDEGNPIR